MYQVPCNRQNSFSIMFFCHFIEKLDNICKIHVSVKNDISVIFHKGHSHKQIKMARRYHSGSPDCFPNQKDITVGKFSLKVQQKPSGRKYTFCSNMPYFILCYRPNFLSTMIQKPYKKVEEKRKYTYSRIITVMFVLVSFLYFHIIFCLIILS